MQQISSPPTNDVDPARKARGWKSLGNRRYRLSLWDTRRSRRRRPRDPRRAGPHGQLHGAIPQWRESNPLHPGCEVSEIFTTSEVRRPAAPLDEGSRPGATGVSGGTVELVGRKAFGGKRSNEARHHPERGAARRAANGNVRCRGAQAKARRLANPIRFALPSVSGFRLVPSEQAPRLRRALSRDPLGSGSPVPA